MLKLTDPARTRNTNASQSSYSLAQKGNANKLSSGNSAARADRIQLTPRAKQTKTPNPYAGTAPGSVKVKVGKWGSGKNDSLVSILHSQNYSNEEIYRKNAKGETLLDQIARANKLKNPNLIRAGQDLVMPSKTPDQTATPKTVRQTTTPEQSKAPTPSKTAKPAAEAKVNQVKVGKWGKDSNGSLYGILKNQGFSRKQILNQDGQGDSLLNKVARANGLADANKIREGATLKVPNSLEALGQMNVPELAKEPKKENRRQPLTKVSAIKTKPPKLIPIKPEIPTKVEIKKSEQPKTEVATPKNARVTANMGLLLDGVKSNNFKRDEFQYLNALSNRYEETRSQFSKDGFNNEELKTLGKFETNYGVTYSRLYNSDDVKLTNGTPTSTNPKTQLRARHFSEGGTVWDGLKDGTVDNEAAIATMIRQRAEARAQGEK